MSDSTSPLDAIDFSQGNQAAALNGLLNSVIPLGFIFGRRAVSSIGLDWGYYGGPLYVDGVRSSIANGVVALTNNTTNYIQVSRAGSVTKVTGTWDADKLPLYSVVTSGGVATSWEDHRDLRAFLNYFYSHVTISMTAGGEGNKTLTAVQSLADSLEATGTLTATRNLVVPAVRRQYKVFANTASFGVQVISTSGTGVTIAVGKRAFVSFDGTNVVRDTADV